MKSIIVFGDSITFGRFDESNGGWVARLKKYYEDQDKYHAVYNQGVPGDNSKGLLERIDVECVSRARYVWDGDKHVILIAIGINDSRGFDTPDNLDVAPKDYEANVRQIIEIVKKYSPHIAILAITPVDETVTNPFENTYFTNARIEEYNHILKTLAVENNILFVDVYNQMTRLDYTTLLADGVHPNPTGYDFLYKIVKTALVENKLIQ